MSGGAKMGCCKSVPKNKPTPKTDGQGARNAGKKRRQEHVSTGALKSSRLTSPQKAKAVRRVQRQRRAAQQETFAADASSPEHRSETPKETAAIIESQQHHLVTCSPSAYTDVLERLDRKVRLWDLELPDTAYIKSAFNTGLFPLMATRLSDYCSEVPGSEADVQAQFYSGLKSYLIDISVSDSRSYTLIDNLKEKVSEIEYLLPFKVDWSEALPTLEDLTCQLSPTLDPALLGKLEQAACDGDFSLKTLPSIFNWTSVDSRESEGTFFRNIASRYYDQDVPELMPLGQAMNVAVTALSEIRTNAHTFKINCWEGAFIYGLFDGIDSGRLTIPEAAIAMATYFLPGKTVFNVPDTRTFLTPEVAPQTGARVHVLYGDAHYAFERDGVLYDHNISGGTSRNNPKRFPLEGYPDEIREGDIYLYQLYLKSWADDVQMVCSEAIELLRDVTFPFTKESDAENLDLKKDQEIRRGFKQLEDQLLRIVASYTPDPDSEDVERIPNRDVVHNAPFHRDHLEKKIQEDFFWGLTAAGLNESEGSEYP
jgi:hypothetical protein